MGIKCPNCETITMYTEDKFSGRYISNEGYKIGWDDEFYALCINKDCKLEFLVDTGLGEEEKKFVKCVLAPFHKKWWYVDRFIAGGSLTDRSVIGADFLVHHLEGGAVWIEFKRHNKFSFTDAQHLRFKTSLDNEAVATRFIGLINVQKKGLEEYNNHIHFWTPAFYRVIPDESFTLEKSNIERGFKPKRSLNLAGLEQCISNNVYTIKRKPNENIFPLNHAEKEKILQTPNFSIFNLTAGMLFRKAEYERISNEEAFKINALKLRQTVSNRAEDPYWQKKNPYIACEIVRIIRDELRPFLKQKIRDILLDSYRPRFPIEVTKNIEALPELNDCLIRDKKGIPYLVEDIKSTPLRTIIKLTMEIMLREGELSRIKAKDDKIFQYFLKNQVIIPLKITTSEYLDFLQKYVEHRLNQIGQNLGKNISEIKKSFEIKQLISTLFPISNPDLAEFLQIDYNSLRGEFEAQNRDELTKNGLIKIEKRETVYEKGRRPKVMATYMWIVSLTEKGIEYTMKLS